MTLEPALREYRSAAAYVALFEAEGFAVEQGSAELPTAFVARDRSEGPHLAAYAEYDAIPGCSQDAVSFRAPLGGNPHSAARTDPHSALGARRLGARRAPRRTGGGFGAGRPGALQFLRRAGGEGLRVPMRARRGGILQRHR